MRVFLLLALFLPCFGRMFEIGVKGGVPITSSFETGSFGRIGFGELATSATRRYAIGPVLEFRLPYGFAVEVDALYRRLGFDEFTVTGGLLFTYTRAVASTWEFPLLAKYRLPFLRIAHPYIDVGPSFRTLRNVSVSTITSIESRSVSGPVATSTDPHLSNRSNTGVAVGAGVDLEVKRLHVSPELRYTRWRVDRMRDPYLYSNQNEIVFLLGVTF